ncbi:MAG TPA: GDSL-type esterase/lipase family protein [Planctomycetaceae bacterium]|jgi:acyl-CoA thioesterase-1|nr:GDSL-type esterase/lipase family protein [Planctomycetaceae bacterium]
MPLNSSRQIASLALLVWCLIGSLWNGLSSADEPPLRIVTLGDSITKGVRQGVAADETFSALLEAALKKRGVTSEVINVGIGGERTDQALARLDKEVVGKKPRIVAIMYGTNDSYVDKGKSEPRLTADEFRTNLAGIVDKLESAGIRPILMTEPRWGKSAKNGLDENPNGRLEKYMDACRALARERKLPLVDHFADWTEAEAQGADIGAWTTDQCHPNPAGHRRMAELILPVVLKAAAAN